MWYPHGATLSHSKNQLSDKGKLIFAVKLTFTKSQFASPHRFKMNPIKTAAESIRGLTSYTFSLLILYAISSSCSMLSREPTC